MPPAAGGMIPPDPSIGGRDIGTREGASSTAGAGGGAKRIGSEFRAPGPTRKPRRTRCPKFRPELASGLWPFAQSKPCAKGQRPHFVGERATRQGEAKAATNALVFLPFRANRLVAIGAAVLPALRGECRRPQLRPTMRHSRQALLRQQSSTSPHPRSSTLPRRHFRAPHPGGPGGMIPPGGSQGNALAGPGQRPGGVRGSAPAFRPHRCVSTPPIFPSPSTRTVTAPLRLVA